MADARLSLSDYLRTPVSRPTSAPAAATSQQFGTQDAPLESFYSSSGATGNKTTNKDLPQWLRDLGMKGDAYAGGMLKPQLRYGFWYKNGKIHFADGTSYKAKKTKGADGKVAYAYTGSDGKAATYSPTDEQNAYNKNYKAKTSSQSFWDKAKNTVKLELAHMKDVTKTIVKDPSRTLTGPTPIGTKVHNEVFGTNHEPLTGQLGGSTQKFRDDYEAKHGPGSLGYANEMNAAANAIASYYAGAYFGGAPIGAMAAKADEKFGANSKPKPGAGGTAPGSFSGMNTPSTRTRRFQRTTNNLFSDLRGNGDPMKLTIRKPAGVPRQVGMSPPQSIPSPVKPRPTIGSSPKTPPAVNYGRMSGGLSDVRIPRRPMGKIAR